MNPWLPGWAATLDTETITAAKVEAAMDGDTKRVEPAMTPEEWSGEKWAQLGDWALRGGVAEVKIHGCWFSEQATEAVKLTPERNVRLWVAEADLRRLVALVEAHEAARPAPHRVA